MIESKPAPLQKIALDKARLFWHIPPPIFLQTNAETRLPLPLGVRPKAGAVMRAEKRRRVFVLGIPLLCLAALSCRSVRNTRTYHAPPPPDVQPTILAYVETDAFDNLFETVLNSRAPVILIQTDTSQPDWGPHLNAWLAAWNRGGQVVDEARRRVRMQAPLSPTVVNGETLREFRLLIDDLMTRSRGRERVEAHRGGPKSACSCRRIELLKPYSLRFHLDADQKIQLVFFNGQYARYYSEIMDAMSMNDQEDNEWSRTVTCSHCKEKAVGTTMQRTRACGWRNDKTNAPARSESRNNPCFRCGLVRF